MNAIAREAWSAMQEAIIRRPPPCDGDARFTADELQPRDLAELTNICNGCHLAILCGSYARADRVTGGFWAGTVHRKRHADG